MNFVHSGSQLSLADIEEFEKEIGAALPGAYKQFLLTSNGGLTEPRVGFRWNGKIHKVPGFNQLKPTNESGLRRAHQNLIDLGIEGLLPIASTQNEEDICLDLVDKVGTVRLALPVRDSYVRVSVTLVRIAGSFSEFLSLLFPLPEVYCPIYEIARHGTVADLDAYLAAGNSIDALGKRNLSILCEAIKFDNMPLIHACIERGAKLSRSVYIAAANKRPDVIRELVRAGADVNERDDHGDTPLHWVGGTELPGTEGALNREIRDVLLELGAVE